MAAAFLRAPEGSSRAPWHVAGAVQAGAWVLAFAPDWSISHVSANCGELLHCDADGLLGRAAHAAIAGPALHEIRSRAQLLGQGGGVSGERLFGLDLAGDGRMVDATLHVLARGWLLAGEPADLARRDPAGTVLRMAAALRAADSLAELCAAAARDVRALTGFDRVQVLRFGTDADGARTSVVVAESAGAAAADFAPLMFAAPGNGALHGAERLRLIGDRDAPGVPVLAAAESNLDLTPCGLGIAGDGEFAALAAVGAHAMASVPLRACGVPWGAIVCCHGEARRVPFAVRPALELLAAMLGLLVELASRPAEHRPGATGANATATEPLSGRVLVVEDNMLIAMEAEEIVLELGAGTCDVAGSLAKALRLIDAQAYEFALLDIELGHETSAAVAVALAGQGVPFVYASGYGGPDALAPEFPQAPVVTKPYGKPELAAAIRTLR